MPNKRIPQLPQIALTQPNFKVPIYNADTDITSHIDVADFLPKEQSQAITFRIDATYPQGALVQSDGRLWVSLQDNNTGNVPADGSLFWEETSKSVSNISVWSMKAYTTNDVFVEHLGEFYKLKDTVTRPFFSSTSPDVDIANWQIVSESTNVLASQNEVLYGGSSNDIIGNADFTYDPINKNFNTGGNSTVTGTDSTNVGLDAVLAARWSFNACERAIIATSANNSATFGFNNIVGDGTQASGNVSFTTGVDNINNGRGLFVGGVGARSLNSGNSGGIAYAIKLGRGRRDVNIPYVTANDGSVNISRNTASQIDLNGALALDSAIFMGVDHHIPATSQRTVVIGGNTIVVDDNVVDTLVTGKLLLEQGISSTLPATQAGDLSLFISSNGEVRKGSATSTNDFWGINGNTDLGPNVNINMDDADQLSIGQSGVFGISLSRATLSFIMPDAGGSFGVVAQNYLFFDDAAQSVLSSTAAQTAINVATRQLVTSGDDQKILFTGGPIGLNVKNGGADGNTSGIPAMQINATFADYGWGTNATEGNDSSYLRFNSGGGFFEDKRSTKLGLQYGFTDYSNLTGNSLVTKGFVNDAIQTQEVENYQFRSVSPVAGIVTLDMLGQHVANFSTAITSDVNINFSNDGLKSSVTLILTTSARFDVTFGAGTQATDQIAGNDWNSGTGTVDLRSGAGTYIFELDIIAGTIYIKTYTETQ